MVGKTPEFGPRRQGLFIQPASIDGDFVAINVPGGLAEKRRFNPTEFRYYTTAESLGFSPRKILEAREQKPFAGKVYLVLGAGPDGIGGAAAREIALEGGTVVTNSRPIEGKKTSNDSDLALVEELQVFGGDAIWIGKNVTDKDAGQVLLGEIVEKYGRLDGIIADAGIRRDRPFYAMDDVRWDEVLETHYRGQMRIIRDAVRRVYDTNRKAEKDSSIESITLDVGGVSSLAGGLGNPGQANYVAAKAAVDGTMRTLAHESRLLYKNAIRAWAVAPGLVETPLVSDLNDEQDAFVLEETGADRRLIPQEVGVFIAYLLHPNTPSNGHIVPIIGYGETPLVDERRILQLVA